MLSVFNRKEDQNSPFVSASLLYFSECVRNDRMITSFAQIWLAQWDVNMYD